MTDPHGPFPGEPWVTGLVRWMPARFREARGLDLLDCYRDLWNDGASRAEGRMAFAIRAVVWTAWVALQQWWVRLFDRSYGEAGMGWDVWIGEVRHAVRRLRRQPAFTAIVVLTLGLGFGANTAVVSVLHSVLVSPLEVEESDRLVRVYGDRIDLPGEFDRLHLSTPATTRLREQVSSFESVAVIENQSPSGIDLTGGDRPERLRLLRTNAEYFETLRVAPMLGRTFDPSEELGESRVAIVTEGVWLRHLGGSAEALGSSLTLDGEAYRVVGVVDDGFRDPLEGSIDVWLPLDLRGAEAEYWNNNWLTAFGRVAPGSTLSGLRSELDALQSRFPEMGGPSDTGFATVPLHEDLVGASRPILLAVFGAVSFLLLLTAVNVASLMMARAARSEREFAVRRSLGSSRSSLLRRFVTEATLLSLAGGLAGVALGLGSLDLIATIAPAGLPGSTQLRMGTTTVLVAAAAAVFVGLVLGGATGWLFSKPSLRSVASGGRTPSVGPRRAKLRANLVRMEIALAVVLLSGAGVLLFAVQDLRSRDLGIDPGGVLTFKVGLPAARYGSDAEIYHFSERLHERLMAIPGAQSAAVTSRLPVTGSFNTWGTRRAYGPDAPHDVPNTSVNQRWIAGDYFETIGLELLRGRSFAPSDAADTPYRTVVNEALVESLFGEDPPLGAWIRVGGRYTQIVGVVENEALTMRSDPSPTAYHHQRQWISGSKKMTQLVRVAGNPMAAVVAARAAVQAVDPDLVVFEPAELDRVVGRGIALERFATVLLAVFAGLALLVAALGLYGVLSHAIAEQRHELGIRLALGADGPGIVGMVVKRGLLLAVSGGIVGLAVVWSLGGVVESLIVEVDPGDPRAILAAFGAVLASAIVASLVPALRAMRVDPAESFRGG